MSQCDNFESEKFRNSGIRYFASEKFHFLSFDGREVHAVNCSRTVLSDKRVERSSKHNRKSVQETVIDLKWSMQSLIINSETTKNHTSLNSSQIFR